MNANLLLLGGTTEANALSRALAEQGIAATYSYAGRVAAPKDQPLPTRTGGFGGVAGLARYLDEHNITHVVDATHPFAAQMSRNAVEACRIAGVPLVALTRSPWAPRPGDDWHRVKDIEGALDALDGAPRRVLLALGRLNMAAFAARPQHHYVLRLVDTPDTPPPLPHHTVVVARGPFDVAGDTVLLQDHGVEVVVCKNSGGTGAEAKLTAARALGLPVIMIDRPEVPRRDEVNSVEEALRWMATS